MRAIVVTRYGPPEVLQLQDIARREPKDNEVLIRVEATVVAHPDCAFRKGDPPAARLFMGLTRPRHIPGDVFAGVIESTGKDATSYKTGDLVFGSSGTSLGCHAEYLTISQSEALAIMPSSVTFGEAAAISEGALTALPFLRDHGKVGSGQKVLINGASGGVGVYAIQLAKYLGAEVTGVSSTANLALIKSLGADNVIDYTKEDFTLVAETYDVIFDAVGKSSFARCKRALKPGGIYLSTVPTPQIMLQTLWTSSFGGKKAIFAATGLRKPSEKKKDLELLAGLMESRQIKPVIDRQYSLEQMAEAHRYVENGHKKGSLVVTVGHSR